MITLPAESDDPKIIAFGSADNISELVRIVARCNLSLPIGESRWLILTAHLVDREVPYIIGENVLRNSGVVEYPAGDN